MKKINLLILFAFALQISFSQEENQEEVNIAVGEFEEFLAQMAYEDSIDNTFVYQYGKVILDNGVASITVPEGYKFLSAKQSAFVLHELWGNPPEEVLGMLFPENESPLGDTSTFAVEISYFEDGYVKDEDAEEVDYEELLSEMQTDQIEINIQRKESGYETVDIIGWASTPFYDEKSKKLHWAKELKFETYDVNTLNYNIRVLGRKGYLMLNAIGDIDVLPTFKKDIKSILESVEFEKGYRYEDFNHKSDKISNYHIGGLISGKESTKEIILTNSSILRIIALLFVLLSIALIVIKNIKRRRNEIE